MCSEDCDLLYTKMITVPSPTAANIYFIGDI